MAKGKPNSSDTKRSQSKKTKKKTKPSNGKDKNVKTVSGEMTNFSKSDLVDILKIMLRSRAIDEKAMRLLKQGKTFFHIAAAGHEAVQVAVGLQLEPQKDWLFPYYRDLGIVLTAGLTP